MENDDGNMTFVSVKGSTGGPVLLDADTLFKVVVLADPDLNLYTASVGTDGGLIDIKAMEYDLVRHRGARVELFVSAVGTSVNLDCYVFARARSACQRLFWSMKDVFGLLEISAYEGQPSKWVGMLHETWDKRFCEWFGESQLVFSTWSSDRSSKKVALPFWRRCLVEPSISTCGFMLLLLKWAYRVAQQGGLSDLVGKLAARHLLESIVNGAQSFGSYDIPIVFDPAWVCKWPRPQLTPGNDHATMVEVIDGQFDIRSLRQLVSGRVVYATPRKWVDELDKVFGKLDFVGVNMLIARLSANHVLQPLLAQIVWAVSLHVEKGMATDISSTVMSKASLQFRWLDEGDWDAGNQDRNVCQYVLCGVEQFGQNVQHIGLSTDKGWTHTLPMQVTLLANEFNLAVHAIPQVFQNAVDISGVWMFCVHSQPPQPISGLELMHPGHAEIKKKRPYGTENLSRQRAGPSEF